LSLGPGFSGVCGCPFAVEKALGSVEELVGAVQQARCVVKVIRLIGKMVGAIADSAYQVSGAIFDGLRRRVDDDLANGPARLNALAIGSTITVSESLLQVPPSTACDLYGVSNRRFSMIRPLLLRPVPQILTAWWRHATDLDSE